MIEYPAVIPDETGFRNLVMLAGLRDTYDLDEIRSLMTTFGLSAEDKRLFREYSLGMRQKLGIIGAIMCDSEFIVLDEPINALDEKSVALVSKMLKELCTKDKIILIACHDREELEKLSDIIYTVEEGEIVDESRVS